MATSDFSNQPYPAPMEELIFRVKAKEEAAFGIIYDRYAPNILGVITTIIPDPLVAEEVLHVVFLKAWRDIDSYNPQKGTFFTWMLNIARNAAIDALRSSKRECFTHDRVATEEVRLPASDDPYRHLDNLDLRTHLSSLPSVEKTLIQLPYCSGFTHKQIAEMLAMPLGTVKTKMQRAYKLLRASLENQESS